MIAGISRIDGFCCDQMVLKRPERQFMTPSVSALGPETTSDTRTDARFVCRHGLIRNPGETKDRRRFAGPSYLPGPSPGLVTPDYVLIAGADVTAKWQGFTAAAIQSLTLKDDEIDRDASVPLTTSADRLLTRMLISALCDSLL
ncbi:hypothetical protein ROHU_007591 [Labeo rohita]|uniref:Uncharacterized protein n=1 Tax=Labeo rohita TaxID=84645 RepID=A0A498MPK0_LABRO|nr:hypothetical protein ROHU_007591 [Labeo rohita]